MQTKCRATKANGAPCNGTARASGWCWFHDPGEAERRAEGRKLGGAARSNRSRTRKEIEGAALTPAERRGYVAIMVRGVITGTKTPGQGQAVAALLRADVALAEATEIEERMAELERRLGSRAS